MSEARIINPADLPEEASDEPSEPTLRQVQPASEASEPAPATDEQSSDATAQPSETAQDQKTSETAQDQVTAEMPAPEDVTQAASTEEEPFDAPVRTDPQEDDDDKIGALVVNLEGYEGPLDILLELARTQKVDLRKISMLALVEQYLAFVDAAKERRLELAADYLVMAAWLAFLKSKLLLPAPKDDGEEPSADEMAARLQFQLQRLEAMRNAAEALTKRPRFGVDVIARGAPEGVRVKRTADWQASLYDLLQAYARQRVAAVERSYKPELPKVFRIEEARDRLRRILGDIPEWVELASLASKQSADAPRASVVASAFVAALEFAKDGKIDLRQTEHFQPIYVRQKAELAAAQASASATATTAGEGA